MDASVIYDNVCVDAGGSGSVLDGVKCLWPYPNANNQETKQIKNPPDGGCLFFICF